VTDKAKAGSYQGSCLCGGFRFEVTGPLENVRLCHCDLCRKANGTAFSANCKLPIPRFRVLHDEGLIRAFEASPGAFRNFCSRCGSPVFSRLDGDPDHIRIRLGTLDRGAQANIIGHVWTGSMASWDNICDDLPQFERAGS
jgi:hypothetical protein